MKCLQAGNRCQKQRRAGVVKRTPLEHERSRRRIPSTEEVSLELALCVFDCLSTHRRYGLRTENENEGYDGDGTNR